MGRVQHGAGDEVQPIVWPPRYKTGDIVYPYAEVKK
jgi:hypothetical protein